jgi:hypothetical protein
MTLFIYFNKPVQSHCIPTVGACCVCVAPAALGVTFSSQPWLLSVCPHLTWIHLIIWFCSFWGCGWDWGWGCFRWGRCWCWWGWSRAGRGGNLPLHWRLPLVPHAYARPGSVVRLNLFVSVGNVARKVLGADESVARDWLCCEALPSAKMSPSLSSNHVSFGFGEGNEWNTILWLSRIRSTLTPTAVIVRHFKQYLTRKETTFQVSPLLLRLVVFVFSRVSCFDDSQSHRQL